MRMSAHVRKSSRIPTACIGALLCLLSAAGISSALENPAHDTRDEARPQEAVKPKPAAEKKGTDPEIDRLQHKARIAVESYEREHCEKKGLLRYHGKCMGAREKTALFESEVRYVESLLAEAIKLYKTASPQEVSWMFHRTEQFVEKFDADAAVDRRIAEKILILLGFVYLPAERIDNEMNHTFRAQQKNGMPIAMLEQRARREAFSSQVYVPIMNLFGKQIDEYIELHGMRDFAKLMADNSLEDVIRRLQGRN